VDARKQRLFIALWPPAASRKALARLAEDAQAICGGRKIPEQKQHVTLAFLGDVEVAEVPDAKAALSAAGRVDFEFTLDALQYRRNGGMLWARPTQTPAELLALVERLRTALRARGLRAEERPFVTHITLLRDAVKPVQVMKPAPVSWRVREVVLVRSRLAAGGAEYQVVHRAP
jgi:2'-5' RNA ligase